MCVGDEVCGGDGLVFDGSVIKIFVCGFSRRREGARGSR